MDSDKSPKDTDESDGDDSDYLAGFDLDKEVVSYLENLQSIPIELLRPKDDEIIETDKCEKNETNYYDPVKSAVEDKKREQGMYNSFERLVSDDDDVDNLYGSAKSSRDYTKEKRLPISNEGNSNNDLEAISDNDLAGDDIESGEYYSSEEEGVLNSSDPQLVDVGVSDGEVGPDFKVISKKHVFNDIKSLSITVSNNLAYENNTGKKLISKEEYERNKIILEEYYKKCDLYMKQMMKKEKKKKKHKSLKKVKSVIELPRSHTKSEHTRHLKLDVKKDKAKHQKEKRRTSSKSPEKKRRSSYDKVKKSEHKYKLPEKINKKHKHYKKYIDYIKKEYKKKHGENKSKLKKAAKELEKQGLLSQNGIHVKKKRKIIPMLSFSQFCKSRELSPDVEIQNVEVSKPQDEIEILNLSSPMSPADTEAQAVEDPTNASDDGELFVTYSDLVKQNAFDNDPRMKGLSVFQQALFKIRPSKGIPFLQDDHQDVNDKKSPPKQFSEIITQPVRSQSTNILTADKKVKHSAAQTPISFHNKALSNIIGKSLAADRDTSSAVKPVPTTVTSRSRSRSPSFYTRKHSLSSLSKSRSKSPTRSRTPPRAYRRRRSRSKSRPKEKKRYRSSSPDDFQHHIVYRPLNSRKRRSRSRDRHRSRSYSKSKRRYRPESRSRHKIRSRSRSRSRSRTRYRCRSPPPKVHRSPPPKVHRSPPPESDRRYRRSKSPFKSFADQLRFKLKEENERALAMLRKTIDEAAVTCKNAQAASKISSHEIPSTKVLSDNLPQKYEKDTNKKYNIFKPSDLECLLPAEFSQISSSESPSSRSETSVSLKRVQSPAVTHAVPSPKIPDVSVPPPCITSVPPPVPKSTTSILEEETKQIVVTTYTNYVPFVSNPTPNLLQPAPPGTLAPYVNPELGQYRYNNYLLPRSSIPPPHMFPPQMMARYDQEMVMHQNVNQPHFPFINQQQFHYPLGLPQFPNSTHNPFPPAVNQPQNVSVVDVSKQTVMKTGNISKWPQGHATALSDKSQTSWSKVTKKDQNYMYPLEATLKKDQTFLDQVTLNVNKAFLNKLEGGKVPSDRNSFNSVCCVHSHFKTSSNINSISNPKVGEVIQVIKSTVSKENEMQNIEDKKNKIVELNADCIIDDSSRESIRENNCTSNKTVTKADLDDVSTVEDRKFEILNENPSKKIKFTLNLKPKLKNSTALLDEENKNKDIVNVTKIDDGTIKEDVKEEKELCNSSAFTDLDKNLLRSTHHDFSESNSSLKIDTTANIKTGGISSDKVDYSTENSSVDEGKVKTDTIESKTSNKSTKEESKISILQEIVKCGNTATEELKDMAQNGYTDSKSNIEENSPQSSKIDRDNGSTDDAEESNFSSKKDESEVHKQSDSESGNLLDFSETTSNDTVIQIKNKTTDSNPSYKKKINLENKINKLIQVLSSSTTSTEDSKTVINNLVDNILADEQSKQIIEKSNKKSAEYSAKNENLEKSDVPDAEQPTLKKNRKNDKLSLDIGKNDQVEKESKSCKRDVDLNVVTNENASDITNEIEELKNEDINNEAITLKDNKASEIKNKKIGNTTKVIRKFEGTNNDALKSDGKDCLSVVETITITESDSDEDIVLSDLSKGMYKKKVESVENSNCVNETGKLSKDASNSEIHSCAQDSSVHRITRGQIKDITESDGVESNKMDRNRSCKRKVDTTPKSSPRHNSKKVEIEVNEKAFEEQINNIVNEVKSEQTKRRGRKKKW